MQVVANASKSQEWRAIRTEIGEHVNQMALEQLDTSHPSLQVTYVRLTVDDQ